MDEKATPVQPKRILLVDDDAEIIESMRFALEAKGYTTLVARDGNQGLAMAEREDPDLVILDMMMPKRSGFLVLEKLRRTRPVPMRIIMITANEGSRHKAYAEMLGVVVGALVAVWFYQTGGGPIGTLFFASLAYSNWQMLQQGRGGSLW